MDIMTKERLIKLAEEEIPIHKYFGLKVEIVEKDFIKVRVPFRKDLVGDIRTNHWHGGIIATILDSVGSAIGIANFNSPEDKLSTIDLRVDYLRFANGNDLVFEGKQPFVHKWCFSHCENAQKSSSGTLLLSVDGPPAAPEAIPGCSGSHSTQELPWLRVGEALPSGARGEGPRAF